MVLRRRLCVGLETEAVVRRDWFPASGRAFCKARRSSREFRWQTYYRRQEKPTSRDLRGRPADRDPPWKQRHSHGLSTATWFQGRFAPRRGDESALNRSALTHDGEYLPSNLGAAPAAADGDNVRAIVPYVDEGMYGTAINRVGQPSTPRQCARPIVQR